MSIISNDGKAFKRLPKKYQGAFTVPEGVEHIAKGAFSGCKGLTSITLPSTLKTIGEEAFSGCSKLDTLNIPNRVETISDNAFSLCLSLKAVELPTSLKMLGKEAFYSCINLMEIDIPDGIITIPVGCFRGCGLSRITLPHSIQEIGDFAFLCCHIKEVETGPNVIKVGNCAFSFNQMKYLCISSSVREIGWGAWGFNNLQSIRIDPQNELYTDAGCNVIMEKASGKVIQGCSCCKIPVNAKNISSLSFAYQKTPKELIIPSSVETIESLAFMHCGNTEIILQEGVKVIQGTAFVPSQAGEMSVHIPTSVIHMDGQHTSVDFYLNSLNQHFYYDSEGNNIISKEGDLVWGHLAQGIPKQDVVHISAIIDLKMGYDELFVPKNVKSIENCSLTSGSGVKRLILSEGTKIRNPGLNWTSPCEIHVIIPIKESDEGITKEISYIIPKGIKKDEINESLGNNSFFE